MIRNYIQQTCINCEAQFQANKKTAKYCSQDCANEYKKKTRKYVDYRKTSVSNTLKSLFWHTRFRSRKRRIECTITEDYLLTLLENQEGKCELTGVIMHPARQGGLMNKDPLTISIDRINPLQGYIEGNIQLVCAIVNFCKNSYQIEDVTNMCKEFVRHNNINVNE